jgi:hypothetical protein
VEPTEEDAPTGQHFGFHYDENIYAEEPISQVLA